MNLPTSIFSPSDLNSAAHCANVSLPDESQSNRSTTRRSAPVCVSPPARKFDLSVLSFSPLWFSERISDSQIGRTRDPTNGIAPTTAASYAQTRPQRLDGILFVFYPLSRFCFVSAVFFSPEY